MSEVLNEWLYTMLYSGCICGFILYVCPSGKIKELMETGAVCIMLLAFVSPLVGVARFGYKDSIAEFMESVTHQELLLEKSAESLRNTLITEEYEAYIFSEATDYDIQISEIVVVTADNGEGVPLPVEVFYYSRETIPWQLKEQVAAQLGVALERQYTYEFEDAFDQMAGRAEE